MTNLGKFSHGWTFADRTLEDDQTVGPPWPLFLVGSVLLLLALWLLVEAGLALRAQRGKPRIESLLVLADPDGEAPAS